MSATGKAPSRGSTASRLIVPKRKRNTEAKSSDAVRALAEKVEEDPTKVLKEVEKLRTELIAKNSGKVKPITLFEETLSRNIGSHYE